MYAPGYAPGLYVPGHAPGLSLGATVTAEPGRGARMPAAAGTRGGPTGVHDSLLVATVLDAPTGKRPLDVPTGSAVPARGAKPGGD